MKELAHTIIRCLGMVINRSDRLALLIKDTRRARQQSVTISGHKNFNLLQPFLVIMAFFNTSAV